MFLVELIVYNKLIYHIEMMKHYLRRLEFEAFIICSTLGSATVSKDMVELIFVKSGKIELLTK